jgi:HSP20 family protein
MILVPMTRASSDLARSFDRLFDDTFQRFFDPVPAADNSLRSPAMDVAETERDYRVSLELPGMSKDDVKITIEGRHVSISAQAPQEPVRRDGERVIYRERASTRFARSFTLPEEIDQDASAARLEHGVLLLTLAKKRATASKQLSIS